MKRIEVVLVLVALALGPLLAMSLSRWYDAVDRGNEEIRTAKIALMKEAGLFELHNQIFTKVGPYDWENRVKPAFMSAITWATVRETGNSLPSACEVIDWVRTNPERARQLLLDASRSGND